MGRIISLAEAIEFTKSCAKSTGYISGCFDIVHIGHISLFRKAKSCVDFLLIGVDPDATIRLNKGPNRPINRLEDRLEFIAEISCVDYVFSWEATLDYSDVSCRNFHHQLLSDMRPSFVFTTKCKDDHIGNRASQCSELGIELVQFEIEYKTSTSRILDLILKEN